MTIRERINSFFRLNTNPSPLTDESISRTGRAYSDPLVMYQHNDYLNQFSRKAVMMADPIANKLTYGWATLATAKTFKFYQSHEVGAVEIMQEYRQWWQQMNLDEVLKAAIPDFSDGYVLLDLFIDEGGLGYDVYGNYECPEKFWLRDPNNEILQYRVHYIPITKPFGFRTGTHTLKAVNKIYQPQELIHGTRGFSNFGLGISKILPVWDAITKLRHGSHADFFRRDIRFISAVPQNWKDQRVKNFVETLNTFMNSSNRAFIYKMEQQKNPSQMPLDLPRFGYTSMAEGSPKPLSSSEVGGELLRDPEWARILSGTGHTENFFIGNQAGAITGSEVDLTRDFYAECQEFSLLEPLIKLIINWFVQMGVIPEPPGQYVIKYWKDWEHIEKEQALMQQEQSRWETAQGKRVAGETRRKELRQQAYQRTLDKFMEASKKKEKKFYCTWCDVEISGKDAWDTGFCSSECEAHYDKIYNRENEIIPGSLRRKERWLALFEKEWHELAMRRDTGKSYDKARLEELTWKILDLEDEIKAHKSQTTFTSLGLKRKNDPAFNEDVFNRQSIMDRWITKPSQVDQYISAKKQRGDPAMERSGLDLDQIKRLYRDLVREMKDIVGEKWSETKLRSKLSEAENRRVHELTMQIERLEREYIFLRRNRWITIDGGTEDARHVWVGGGQPPPRKGQMTMQQFQERERKKIVHSLDWRGPQKRLDLIKQSYENLDVSDEEFNKIMFDLYNRVYTKKIKSYTKDFEDFKDRRYIEKIEGLIKAEENKIKKRQVDPKKSRASKERYETGELKYLNAIKKLEQLAYTYDPKKIRTMVEQKMEIDEIVESVFEDMHGETGDYGAGEIDWEAIEQRDMDVYGESGELRKWRELEKADYENYMMRQNLGIAEYYIFISRRNEIVLGQDIDKLPDEEFNAIFRQNINRPMTAVMSSTVKAKGVYGSDFLVQFHDTQGTYRYHFEDPEEAEKAYHEISEESPGGYIWDRFRYPNKGPAYFSGRMVYGGTTASQVPYDISGRTPVGRMPNLEEQAKAMREYKMEGDRAKGIIGAGTTREPLRFDPNVRGGGGGAGPSQGPPTIPMNPTGFDPGWSNTPSSNPLQFPKVQNKSIFNSAAKIMRLAKDQLDWGMSKNTPYKIMDLMKAAQKEARRNVFRINEGWGFTVVSRENEVAYGNGIKAGHPMYYRDESNGTISEEYICPQHYAQNVGKIVPLGVYHNKNEYSTDLPEWQIIGTYEILNWDEEKGQDYAKLTYDREKIKKVFNELGEEDWITPLLDAGKIPDVSTAYPCDVVYDQKTKRNYQVNINLRSVSFVPMGNCPGSICNFKEEAIVQNTKPQGMSDSRWRELKEEKMWFDKLQRAKTVEETKAIYDSLPPGMLQKLQKDYYIFANLDFGY